MSAQFTIDDLTTPLTVDEVRTSIYEIIAATGGQTTLWKPGAIVRTLITGFAVVIAASSFLIAQIARSGFLELAEGQWLTLTARYVYGVGRTLATRATGVVTLTNTGGGSYSLDPGDLVLRNSVTGKTYTNSELVELDPSETLVGVAVIALEAGTASNASAGQVTEFETPLDATVTVVNPAAIVGTDDESDTNLRLRCREKLGALSPNGPSDAYAYAARNAVRADGSAIGVTRVRVVKTDVNEITTYVASATGGITGDQDDADTDLGAIHEAIQRLAVPLAITAITASATPVTIAYTYEVWMYNTSGLEDSEIETLIETALVDFTSAQPVGGNVIDPDPGKVFHATARAAIIATRPEIFQAAVTTPAGDTTIGASEVPVAGTVTATAIHQIAPGAL